MKHTFQRQKPKAEGSKGTPVPGPPPEVGGDRELSRSMADFQPPECVFLNRPVDRNAIITFTAERGLRT